MAARRPRIRLTKVDLPTLGRPTTATLGRRPGCSSSCRSTDISLCLLLDLTIFCRRRLDLPRRVPPPARPERPQAQLEELAGRPAPGPVAGRLGEVDRRADHDPDRRGERGAPGTPRAPAGGG